MRYFLEMSYKGTAYHGWQRQENALAVQQVVEESLTTLLRHETPVTGAGRTDTGVHASYYVAHFDTDGPIAEPGSFVYHLNAVLPCDISVHTVKPVTDTAHARFDAIMREYRYYLLLSKNVFRKETACYLRGPEPDVEAMNEAAARLLVHKDFTTFCKLHSDNRTNICNITYARWECASENELVFTIRSDRFLRNMVRSLAGTLMDVGRGKMTVNGFDQAVAARDLSRAGATAPAQGLFLSDVRYPDNIFKRQI